MRKVTCYAWGKPGDWEALCVDFDLAAQGASLEEVQRELSDAVDTFLDYVSELPEDEQRAFLNRKAPPGVRLRLALASKFFGLLSALKIRAGGRELARTQFVMTPTT